MRENWQISIDTGGTFTDCLARAPDSSLHRAKVLSTSSLRGRVREVLSPQRVRIDAAWEVDDGFINGLEFGFLVDDGRRWRVRSFDSAGSLIELDGPLIDDDAAGASFQVLSSEPAPILAARVVTGTPFGLPLPPLTVRLATTRGTNALLERRSGPVAFFVTEGFGDLLVIGDQQRPDLFALEVLKPPPLYEVAVEVPGRLAADGSVIRPLDPGAVEEQARELLGRGIRSAAVALLHSYANPAHERALAGLLDRIGFEHVACSCDLAPLIKILPRAETAVVEAFLAPVLTEYLKQVSETAQGGKLHVMTSAGGLVDAGAYRACDSLLSGPAGGVVGAAAAGRRSGFERIIGFDMGGTSTDVARYDGDFDYRFEHSVGGARLVAPALAIETVAAGGGSICQYENGALAVGPRSASADPGPACYGAGGPLTLTDVNLLAGRLDPERFDIPVDRAAANCALDRLCRQVAEETGSDVDRDELVDGLLEIANQRMADAIGKVSIGQGYDPSDYAMVSFGGAGGQHACAIAERLGIETVVMPADASLLSAAGLSQAVVERFMQMQVLQPFDNCRPHLKAWINDLACRARDAVIAEGVPPTEVVVRRRIVSLRLLGQETSLPIEAWDAGDLPELFASRYAAMYGHRPTGRPIEVESIRVVASSGAPEEEPAQPSASIHEAEATGRAMARFGGRNTEIPTFDRRRLSPGARLYGPALVLDRHSAFVIEPGWIVEVDGQRALILRRESSTAAPRRESEAEIVRLELFTNRFIAIAGEMGQILQRTALSTNVKERLDYSCAILDADGGLVVNAPHIPVHLGAMSLCVQALKQSILKDAAPGDVVITNHPAYGGSHLPDITVVSPVFEGDHGPLLGYVANKAHHAEIGGVDPGSMPAGAGSLIEEAVVIPPMHLLKGGESQLDSVREYLMESPYPTRSPEENIADIRAQLAANMHGAAALISMAGDHGAGEIARRMRALQDRAERLARQALSRFGDGSYEAREELDDGSTIGVVIQLEEGMMRVDFAGSSPAHPGNLNATPAVVHAAVLYVLRLMIAQDLPLNEGILWAANINIPRGMLNPEFPADLSRCPAVAGGNVETSQRIVDTLLKALSLCACSQGTMNNIVFGGEGFGYYETICGGCGATPAMRGADAVHSHMTNTRITDAEIVEHRYPVRIERFAVRKGSGGAGRHPGGDGVTREFVFNVPVDLNVLTQHRTQAPFGMAGGNPGSPGSQRVVRADGDIVALSSVDGFSARAGDRLVMNTPGGGGFGPPEDAS